MAITQPTYPSRTDDLVTHVGAYADKVSSEASMASTQSTSFGLTLDMKGQVVPVSSSGAVVATIPNDSTVSFPVGSWIEIDRMGTGTVTVAAASGVTIRNAAAALTLRAQYSTAMVRKIGANEWLIVGDLG